MDEYVKILADFAQRRLGTDLGLRELEDKDPLVGINGKRHEPDGDGGGGWGPPLPGFVQQQVDVETLGLSSQRTESARAVTVRRCPNSGVEVDFLPRPTGPLAKMAITFVFIKLPSITPGNRFVIIIFNLT